MISMEGKTEDNALALNKIDFDYILNHCDQCKHEIPHSFDKILWRVGETYRIRIGNIYDPSKFWIVHFEKELTLFHEFINNFYNQRSNDYHMPKEVIKSGRYCAVYTDEGYYRGLIVDIPKFTSLELKVVVFLFDFGFTSVVTSDNLFYLNEKLYNTPRFAIKACLADIIPEDSNTWTNKAVEKFNELTKGKVLLCALECRDYQSKIVYIRVGEVIALNQIKEVSQVLLEENLAKSKTRKKPKSETSKVEKLLPKVKYPFLFPSYHALEIGLMPSSHYVAGLVKMCPVPASILYKAYYNYNAKVPEVRLLFNKK